MTAVVVGVDPSLTAVGIAHLGDVYTIKSHPDGDTLDARFRRLQAIAGAVHNVALGARGSPTQRADLVVIEAPSLGQHRQAGTLDRMGLWWLIVANLSQSGIPVVAVPPSTLKKFATGKGNATKPDMRMALYKRTGLDLDDDNQVDAWWLAEIGRHLKGEPTVELPAAHLGALDKLQGVLA